MKLVFLGTPAAAVPSLEALVMAGHDVVTVVTRPDRRRGRGSELLPSPVKEAALRLHLPVVHRVRDLDDLEADYGIVVAYGAMIPQRVLDRIPMLNVHFSLLPRWRGAAPVERAVLAGDAETGVGIMGLEATLDTGPIFAERRVPVAEKTSLALTEELASVGAALLVEVLASPEALANPRPQVGEATYAEKLTPETFRLDPGMMAEQAARIVRLGRAWCEIGGRRFRVHEAGAGPEQYDAGRIVDDGVQTGLAMATGTLWLRTVQPEGSKVMPSSAWRLGARLPEPAVWS